MTQRTVSLSNIIPDLVSTMMESCLRNGTCATFLLKIYEPFDGKKQMGLILADGKLILLFSEL